MLCAIPPIPILQWMLHSTWAPKPLGMKVPIQTARMIFTDTGRWLKKAAPVWKENGRWVHYGFRLDGRVCVIRLLLLGTAREAIHRIDPQLNGLVTWSQAVNQPDFCLSLQSKHSLPRDCNNQVELWSLTAKVFVSLLWPGLAAGTTLKQIE